MATTPTKTVATTLTQIIGILTQANVAVPVVLGTVTTVVGLVKLLKGDAPPLSEIIADIEKQIAENQARGDAEIARLKALLEQ